MIKINRTSSLYVLALTALWMVLALAFLWVANAVAHTGSKMIGLHGFAGVELSWITWLTLDVSAATLCLTAAIYVLEIPCRGLASRWWKRLIWGMPRRVLIMFQLVTTLLVWAMIFAQWLGKTPALPKAW